MLRRRRPRSAWKEEGGHTLVETLVALAIVVTVLVPAGAALVRFGAEAHAGARQEAHHLAVRAVESLCDAPLADRTRTSGDHPRPSRLGSAEQWREGRWTVERRQSPAGGMVDVLVRVTRSHPRNAHGARPAPAEATLRVLRPPCPPSRPTEGLHP
jgi:type II secretory pathway component PulJ